MRKNKMCRSFVTSTKLTPYENELLKIAAKKAKITKSEYLRSLLLDNLKPQSKTAA